MKNLLLIVFVFLTISARAQEPVDVQWYITESFYKDTLGYVDRNERSLDTFCLINEPQPDLDQTYPGRNDLFIIYFDTGKRKFTYTNTYKNEDWESGQKSNIGYQVILPSNPIYFYLTNGYEGDDPKSFVVPGGNCTKPDTLIPPINIATPPLSVNHDIVKEKDFTIIIDLDLKAEEGEGFFGINHENFTNYRLCFDKIRDSTGTIIDGEFEIESSPVFFGNTFILNGSFFEMLEVVDNCVQNLSLSPYGPTFVNLYAPEEISNFINDELLITLWQDNTFIDDCRYPLK